VSDGHLKMPPVALRLLTTYGCIRLPWA
jgi:hypothetical protein